MSLLEEGKRLLLERKRLMEDGKAMLTKSNEISLAFMVWAKAWGEEKCKNDPDREITEEDKEEFAKKGQEMVDKLDVLKKQVEEMKKREKEIDARLQIIAVTEEGLFSNEGGNLVDEITRRSMKLMKEKLMKEIFEGDDSGSEE